MKLDLDKIFYGPIRQITEQHGHSDINSPGKSGIVSNLETVAIGLVYEVQPNIFQDLITKNVYLSSTIFSEVGDLVVKKQELVPINTLCKKLQIELPQTVKTSSKQLKLIKKLIIKESIEKVKTKTHK